MSKTAWLLPLIISILALTACNPTNSENAPNPTINTSETLSTDLQLTVQVLNAEDTFNTVGQVINYSYILQNTGTETHFNGPVTITDDRAAVTCPALNSVGNLDDLLDSGESITCTGTYRITQDNIDSGNVVNSATASVQDSAFLSNVTSTNVMMKQSRELTLTTKVEPTIYEQVGQVITFTYAILNSGNVTLGPAQFIVSDALLGAPFNCGLADAFAQPKGLINCSSTYTITQADLDANSITSNATATDGVSTSAVVSETVMDDSSPQTPSSGLTPGTTIQHTVVPGEWLMQIARCYGADYDSVRRANPHIYNPTIIWSGQVVSVPNIGSVGQINGPPCVVFHTAAADDTWESIALQYNARLDVLQRANSGGLFTGAVIKVPINSAGVSSSQAPVTKQIRFPAGATSAIEFGRLEANSKIIYLVAASQGQTMNIALTAPAGQIAMGIYDSTGSVLLYPDDLAFTWNGILPTNGDYRIDLSSAAGPADKLYSLNVETISPTASLERVADIMDGEGSSDPLEFSEYDNVLYFAADGGDGTGRELWKFDGTNASLAADICSGSQGSNPVSLTVYSGALFFGADGGDGAGYELWKFDGANASRAADIRSGSESSTPGFLTVYNGALYFSADGGDGAGTELWKYDGNSASRVADIWSGPESSNPFTLAVYKDMLYFSADGNDGSGIELWKYDGTNANLAADICSGSETSFPNALTVYNDVLYFGADAYDYAGDELWKFDGTSASRVADIWNGWEGSGPHSLAVYNGDLYFRANSGGDTGYELWKYDGYSASRVADVWSGSESSEPRSLTVYNGALYFGADGGDGAGRELWMYKNTVP
jgi:ELWxxDGT repeat protein